MLCERVVTIVTKAGNNMNKSVSDNNTNISAQVLSRPRRTSSSILSAVGFVLSGINFSFVVPVCLLPLLFTEGEAWGFQTYLWLAILGIGVPAFSTIVFILSIILHKKRDHARPVYKYVLATMAGIELIALLWVIVIYIVPYFIHGLTSSYP